MHIVTNIQDDIKISISHGSIHIRVIHNVKRTQTIDISVFRSSTFLTTYILKSIRYQNVYVSAMSQSVAVDQNMLDASRCRRQFSIENFGACDTMSDSCGRVFASVANDNLLRVYALLLDLTQDMHEREKENTNYIVNLVANSNSSWTNSNHAAETSTFSSHSETDRLQRERHNRNGVFQLSLRTSVFQLPRRTSVP